MKIRHAFVSNSSSSSFVIALSKISAEDLRKLMNYMDNPQLNTDWWQGYFDDDKGVFYASTNMDNSNLDEWLDQNLPHVKEKMIYQNY